MRCATLHCIALCCIALSCFVLHCIGLHRTALYWIASYCIVLHCIVLHCIALHCWALSMRSHHLCFLSPTCTLPAAPPACLHFCCILVADEQLTEHSAATLTADLSTLFYSILSHSERPLRVMHASDSMSHAGGDPYNLNCYSEFDWGE